MIVEYRSEALLTTLYVLRNLQIGPISKSVCHSQASPVYCNVTLYLIGLIRKSQIKWSVVNTVPGALLTTLFYLQLTSGPNKLEYLSLTGIYILL